MKYGYAKKCIPENLVGNINLDKLIFEWVFLILGLPKSHGSINRNESVREATKNMKMGVGGDFKYFISFNLSERFRRGQTLSLKLKELCTHF